MPKVAEASPRQPIRRQTSRRRWRGGGARSARHAATGRKRRGRGRRLRSGAAGHGAAALANLTPTRATRKAMPDSCIGCRPLLDQQGHQRAQGECHDGADLEQARPCRPWSGGPRPAGSRSPCAWPEGRPWHGGTATRPRRPPRRTSTQPKDDEDDAGAPRGSSKRRADVREVARQRRHGGGELLEMLAHVGEAAWRTSSDVDAASVAAVV